MNKRKYDRQSRLPEFIILCVALIVVGTIGGLSYTSAKSAEIASAESNRAQTVEDLNRTLLSSLKDAETGQRGYLVTGREQYLEPYNQALPAIPGLLNKMDSLTRSIPDQNRPIQAIRPLVDAKLRELSETIDLRRSNQGAQALAIVDGGSGKAVMDEIRSRSAALDYATNDRLQAFRAAADLSTSRLRIMGTGGSILLLGFLIVSAITIFHGLNRRDELFAACFESERKLAITLSSIADGVIATDAKGKVTFLNPVAEELTGWRQEAAAGRPITEIFHIVNETTRDIVLNPLEAAIQEGHAVGLANHTKLIAPDGRECFIDDSAAPIRNENDDIVGGVLVFRDISDKKQSERELAESARELARSNEELQHFAFAASHDLQSPLRSVRTMAQLLARQFGEQLGPEGSEMIGYITDGAGRMTRLVDDLLTLARSTDVDGEPVGKVSVQAAFDAARSSLNAEIAATGATITATALPVVAAREVHVILVLQNILGNALKYRGIDPPVIDVSAFHEDSEWLIRVKDNGIGIDPQYADHIFRPFKRLHGKEYEGTGLGLWTCKRIISGYGGRIWLESEPGPGSTFVFTLPAVQPTA